MRGRPRAAPAETAPSKWKDKDGRWNAKVTVSRRLDGERERLRITRTTKRELDAAVRDIENARDAGQQPWLLENITVEQWLSFWLESILPLSVRWKTLSGYASLMRVHVIPNIGPLPLTPQPPAPASCTRSTSALTRSRWRRARRFVTSRSVRDHTALDAGPAN